MVMNYLRAKSSRLCCAVSLLFLMAGSSAGNVTCKPLALSISCDDKEITELQCSSGYMIKGSGLKFNCTYLGGKCSKGLECSY